MQQLEESQLREKSVEELVADIHAEHATDPLTIDYEAAEKREAEWDGRPTLEVRLPFEGDPALFEYQPNTRAGSVPRAEVSGQELILRFPTDTSSSHLQAGYDRHKGGLHRTLDALRRDVDSANAQLEQKLHGWVQARKEEVENEADKLDGLDL